MTRDLTWKLKAQPTAGELAELVKHSVLSPEEARDIIFNKGKRDNASKVTMVVHMLLDRSYSMNSCRDATITGYNEYVNSLKKEGGKYKFSLTTFDADVEGKLCLDKVHENVYVDDVPKLTKKQFVPRGNTPLYDAFCSTLKNIESRPDEKHLFVVLTDGDENSSSKYNQEDMKRLKAEKEADGNWSFVYLGANQDAWATAQKFGYSSSNVSNFNATEKGLGVTFTNLARSTGVYASSASMNTSSFYTEEQKLENEQTK